MKILLINSLFSNDKGILADRYVPPLGLLYIVAYLRRYNQEVFYIDPLPMRIDDRAFKEFCRRLKPDLIGLNSVTTSFENAVRLAHIVKDACGAPIIVGGPHASALAEETLLRYPVFDFACIGEGEITMLELAKNRAYHKERLCQINGLAFRDGNHVYTTAPRAFIKDLDSLPYPARDLLDMHAYGSMCSGFFAKKGLSTTLLTSRGCAYRCGFCVSHLTTGNVFRSHSPRYVMEEITHLRGKYGVNNFAFIDDTFTADKERTEEICDLILKERLLITWLCETRADCVSERLLLKMKSAGCGLIYFGLESANPLILKDMRKGISPEQARQAITLANKVGIKTIANFIFGNQRETKNTLKETIRFAVSADPYIATFGFLNYLPGSMNYNNLTRSYKDRIADWDGFGFTKAAAFRKIPALAEHIHVLTLKKYLFLAYLKFYYRPRIILRLLKGVSSWPKFIRKAYRFVLATL